MIHRYAMKCDLAWSRRSSYGFRVLPLLGQLLSLSLLFSTQTAFAEATYNAWLNQPTQIYRSAPESFVATPVDLDNDGDLDLVSLRANELGWLVNDGKPIDEREFRVIGPAIDGPVAVNDIDGDGDIDVIAHDESSTDYRATDLVQFENNLEGAGNWRRSVIDSRSRFSSYGHLSLVDIDGDDDIDILEVWPGVAWYEQQTGLDDPWLRREIDESGFAGGIAVATDFDGDGNVDVAWTAISSEPTELGIMISSVDTANPGDWISRRANPTDAASLKAAADLDGDGALDLVVSSGWYRNPVGAPVDWPAMPIFDAPLPERVIAGDIDGDGDSDLVYDVGPDFVWVENRIGDGLGWNSQLIDSDNRNNTISDFAAADLDADGDLDVVVNFYDYFGIFTNSLSTSSNWTFDFGQVLDAPVRVFAGDVDNDGDLDVVTHRCANCDAYWFEQPDVESRVWQLRPLADGSNLNSYFFDATGVLDFDADGDLDITTSSGWIESTDGADDEWVRHEVAELGSRSVGADLDSDGDIDLIGGVNSSERGLIWAENVDGSDESWRLFELDRFDGIRRGLIGVADLNSDGDLDIVAAPGQVDSIYWYRNVLEEGGAVQRAEITGPLGSFGAMSLVDLDDDGDTDVVSGFGEPAELYWHQNDSDGERWQTQRLTETGGTVREIVPIDFDNDGDLDIVYVAASASVHWLENLGESLFWRKHNFGIVGRELAVADFNNDGRLDLLTGGDGLRSRRTKEDGFRLYLRREIPPDDLFEDGFE